MKSVLIAAGLAIAAVGCEPAETGHDAETGMAVDTVVTERTVPADSAVPPADSQRLQRQPTP